MNNFCSCGKKATWHHNELSLCDKCLINSDGYKPEEEETRHETGPIKFGNDWTHLLIRGDDCFFYKQHLQHLVDLANKNELSGYSNLSIMYINELIELLNSTNEGNKK